MGFEKLFTRYGSPSNEANIDARCFLVKPSKIDDLERIVRYDKSASDMINTCRQIIEDMQEYRQALAKRYSEFSVMPYFLRLELDRKKGYDGKVFYHVRLLKVYEDGTTTKEIDESYVGAERHEAFKRFEQLKRDRPGIVATKNIEKSKWER